MADVIDESQVRHVAKLARLNPTDAEVRLFAGQLGEILQYFRQLDAVDTDGVEPMAHVSPVSGVLRADEACESVSPTQALGNAPARDEAFFSVPRVLDQDSGA